MKSFLQVENLSKSFGDKVLFSDVTFGIYEGDKIGLIAKNGAGKTTLLRIVAGAEAYDSGEVTYRNGLRVAYLAQLPELDGQLPVADACMSLGGEAVEAVREYEAATASGDSARLERAMQRMDASGGWTYEDRMRQVLTQLKISDLSQTGGSTLLEEGSVVSGTTRLTGGELKVQGAAEIPDLELAGARVDLVADNQYSKLTIGRLNGEGKFYLNSEVAASHSDELEVQNGHGSFGIAMTDRSYEEVFPDKVHIVQDNGGDAEFHLLGGAVDIGAYRYDLHHEGGEWVLERTSQSTDTAVLSRNAYSAVNSVFIAQMETMNNRFDELHYYRDNGLWIKGGLREMKLHFKDASRSRVNTTTTQIGYDFKLPQQKFDYWLAGVTAGFTDSRQKFDRSGRADGDTMSLGIYSSLMTRNKYFVDVTANYYWHDQKLKSYLPHGADVDGKYKVNGWSLAAETGKRWRLDGGWFAEPHLKMKYISLGNMEHRTSHNTRIKGRGATSLEGRLGASAGYVWDRNEVFVELNLVEEFNGRSKIDVAGVTMKEDISDTMYEIGAGMKFQPAEHLSSYVKVSTLLGDKVEIPVDFNLGVRYEF